MLNAVVVTVQDLSQKIQEYYFDSFDALNQDLQSKLKCNVHADLSPGTMTAIAIIYLVWSGFGRNTISFIRKSSLLEKKNTIYDPVERVYRVIPQQAMDFLRAYAESSVYMGLSNKSPYLVRSRMSMQLSYSGVTNAISNFNMRYCRRSKPYILSYIYESGAFCRAAEAVQNGVELPVYHKNYALTDAGMGVYEQVFGRKFSGKDVLTRYLKRFGAYCECFKNENPPS